MKNLLLQIHAVSCEIQKDFSEFKILIFLAIKKDHSNFNPFNSLHLPLLYLKIHRKKIPQSTLLQHQIERIFHVKHFNFLPIIKMQCTHKRE
jgi:hypothetical protein